MNFKSLIVLLLPYKATKHKKIFFSYQIKTASSRKIKRKTKWENTLFFWCVSCVHFSRVPWYVYRVLSSFVEQMTTTMAMENKYQRLYGKCESEKESGSVCARKENSFSFKRRRL